MRIWFHLGGLIVFGCLFILGKMMSESHLESAVLPSRIHLPVQHLCKVFLYGGRIFEAFALIGAFLEVVIVMILAGGWLVDLLVGLSFAA